MKRIIIVVQVTIIILILVKVISVIDLIRKTDFLPEVYSIANNALAQQAASTPTASNSLPAPAAQSKNPPKEMKGDSLAKQRDLATALLSKKAELENKENNLRAEEQRLLALRREITEKIALLKIQEEKLTNALEGAQASEAKKFKEMAKVYEATPAAKAGSMLEKLDVKTAAGITMNMRKDKAGAVWGHISPQKAVEITKEITRTGGKLKDDSREQESSD